MVIERALEKLRRETAQKTGAAEPASSAALARPGRTHEPRATQRPAFPTVAVDPAFAQVNRILLPGHSGDERTGAAVRMLRTRLLQKLRTNRWTTLALTSPGAGEGKSVAALNIALGLARDKSIEVFLIDLDMRNPSICRYLGVTPPKTLVEYFSSDLPPQDVLFSIGNFDVVAAGNITGTDRSSELVATSRLEELLSYIRSISSDPVIVIDLPPILVTDEALLIAPRVDSTALVVGEGRTRRDDLERARQLLAEFSFAGVILSYTSERLAVDQYGYGYAYRYGSTGQRAPGR